MTVDFERTFAPMVKSAARSAHRSFPRNLLVEDTEQAVWLWALQKRNSLTRLVENDEQWFVKIPSTMRKVAFDYCADQVAEIEGYDRRDVKKYSTRELKVLLTDVFDYRDWQSFSTFGDGQPRGSSQANTTGDRIAALADVKIGLDKVKEDQYNLLVWHYKYGLTFEDLGEKFSISPAAARARLDRSVVALQTALGSRDQTSDEGRRKVRSNAAWRADTANRYEEG